MLGDRVTLVQTSRGCPFSCYFYCPYPLVQGRKWRQRSPEHVFQELKEVVNKFSIHKVFFRDACFTLDRARTVSLCNYIIEGGLDFKWWCETRIDRLDKDLLSLMKRAGLEGINIGVETGDEDVMKSRAKQGINLKMLKEIKKFADRIGVRLHFLMLIGFPEETRMSLYKTYSLIRKLKPKSFYCTVITPYPGTELFDLAHSREWIESYDWSQYYGMTPIMHTDNLSVDELKFAHKLIMRGTHQFKSRGLRSKLELFLVQRSMRKWADGACIDDL
jgi:radical SAM superfamily enzyme YgiQ (UPF0313 family)